MRRPRKHRKLALMLNTGVVATLLPKSNAYADTFPDDTQEDHEVSYCFNGLIANSQDNAHDAMSYLANYTDMTIFFDTGNCAGQTDVYIDSANLSGTKRGTWTCDAGFGGLCYGGTIRVDEAEIDAQAGPFTENLDKTLIHEIGHAVGLFHYDGTAENPEVNPVPNEDDAMISGAVDGASDWRTYTDHRKDHLNDWY